MTHALGSRTSGVDVSSEGGRINTINLPGALVLYGVMQERRNGGIFAAAVLENSRADCQ